MEIVISSMSFSTLEIRSSQRSRLKRTPSARSSTMSWCGQRSQSAAPLSGLRRRLVKPPIISAASCWRERGLERVSSAWVTQSLDLEALSLFSSFAAPSPSCALSPVTRPSSAATLMEFCCLPSMHPRIHMHVQRLVLHSKLQVTFASMATHLCTQNARLVPSFMSRVSTITIKH